MSTQELADNSPLVIKDNALISASYSLDLIEQRLILLAIAKANERRQVITTNTELTVTADDYAQQFHLNKTAAYKALKEAEKKLYSRSLTFDRKTEKGNIERVKRRWITGSSYVENEALVRIKFEGDVIPLVSALEKRFTTYRIYQISKLSSMYAVRLYEILVSWKTKNCTPEISLEELREQLGVLPDEYKRMHHFKHRVLHIAIDQINEHTDIKNVEYQQYWTGRSIRGFSFTFTIKGRKKEKALEAEAEKSSKETELKDYSDFSMTGKQRSHFGGLLAGNSAFGSAYAPTGMTLNDFQTWVVEQLKSGERITEWQTYLIAAGFKFPKQNTK